MKTRGNTAGNWPAKQRGNTGAAFRKPAHYRHTIDFVSIGQKLKAERKRFGYTQEQVAEIIGISVAFVGHLERAERSMSLDTLIRLCNLYQITIDYLLAENLPPQQDNTGAQIADMLKGLSPQQQASALDMMRTFTRHV